MNDLNSIQTQRLKIEPKLVKEGLNIEFIGVVDVINAEKEIGPYFLKIHNYLVSNNIKQILLDFTNLEFLNSSGIKAIIVWIFNDNNLPSDKRYNFVFKTNPDHLWQANSFEVLKMIGADLLTII